jgi:hypothetical protein
MEQRRGSAIVNGIASGTNGSFIPPSQWDPAPATSAFGPPAGFDLQSGNNDQPGYGSGYDPRGPLSNSVNIDLRPERRQALAQSEVGAGFPNGSLTTPVIIDMRQGRRLGSEHHQGSGPGHHHGSGSGHGSGSRPRSRHHHRSGEHHRSEHRHHHRSDDRHRTRPRTVMITATPGMTLGGWFLGWMASSCRSTHSESTHSRRRPRTHHRDEDYEIID